MPMSYSAADGRRNPQKDFLYKPITEKIIGASFEVYRELGYGYLERVYQNALAIEIGSHGLIVEKEAPLRVYFKGELVGEYRTDLLVENVVAVELKVAEFYRKEDEAQLLGQLKASGLKVGILINFGKQRAEFKRLAMRHPSA